MAALIGSGNGEMRGMGATGWGCSMAETVMPFLRRHLEVCRAACCYNICVILFTDRAAANINYNS